MDTLRCPTCLTLLLDASVRRCPACHSKLRKRGQPIVLGERARLSSRPTIYDEGLKARADAAYTAAPVRPVTSHEHELLAERAHGPQPEPTPPEPALAEPALAEPALPEPVFVAELVLDPDPEREIVLEPEREIVLEPEREIVLNEEPSPTLALVTDKSPLDGDLNDILSELHRRARAAVDDDEPEAR